MPIYTLIFFLLDSKNESFHSNIFIAFVIDLYRCHKIVPDRMGEWNRLRQRRKKW